MTKRVSLSQGLLTITVENNTKGFYTNSLDTEFLPSIDFRNPKNTFRLFE